MIYERKTGLNVPRHEQQQQKLHKTWKEKAYRKRIRLFINDTKEKQTGAKGNTQAI